MSPRELELPLASGLRLSARAWGPVDGEPVLAMHGWLDNAASFDGLAPRLCERLGLRIVSLDLPGHGRSSRKRDHYHFVDWVADALAAADALGWQRLSLLGHSMGAGISTLVAGTAVERIDRAVLIEGLGPMSEAPEQAAKRLARSLRAEARKQNPNKRPYPSIEAAADRLRLAAPMDEASATTLVTRGLEPSEDGEGYQWRADPKLRLDSRLRLSEDQVKAFLRAIRCPVLLIRADEGWPHDPAARKARMDCVEGLELVELPGRHHLHLDTPDPVADAIVQFWSAEKQR